MVLETNRHEKANFEEMLKEDKHSHLDVEMKAKLLRIMKKHEDLFAGKKGACKGQDVTLQLRDRAVSYVSKPCDIPLPQREQFKKELDR